MLLFGPGGFQGDTTLHRRLPTILDLERCRSLESPVAHHAGSMSPLVGIVPYNPPGRLWSLMRR
jgi:hypothetical protein